MKLSARLALVAALALPVALPAATLSGTVTNKTTGKPDSGDTAVLLNLQQGMQEAGRTTLDSKGHFSFTVPDTAGMHLVQVEHEKASYYGAVPPNTTTVNVDVYDVVPKVDGLHLYADVQRMETDPQGLSVTESFFIRNESSPPKTQLSTHSFEIYLPPDAQLEGATAMGPGGMAVANSPVPSGEKGHYAFIFPLRPGETRFQLGYRLPYSGSATFHSRVSLPAENLAVMLPKGMKLSSTAFQPLKEDATQPGTQTLLATNVKPGTPVDFTVSGSGSFPREQQGGQGQDQSQGQGPGAMGGGAQGSDDQSAQAGRPGGGLGVPIDTPDPLQKYKWWILSGMGLALVVAAAFILRAKPGQRQGSAAPAISPKGTTPPALTPTPVPAGYRPADPNAAVMPAPNGHSQPSGVLAALKEELFTLETDRMAGKLTESEYAEHKAALEVLLRRALARESPTR